MEAKKIVKKRKSNKYPSGFKKAPQAPRRFKSPYIHFSISQIQKYKHIYKNVKVTSFSSLISKEWKGLPEDDKNMWRMLAEKDKKRYDAEKRLYKGPWQVPSDRPRKDPSAPKRPPSAFLNYSQTRRKELIGENPNVKNTDISKLLGLEWRAAPQEVRQPHIDKEAREREEYHRKVSAWRKQERKNKETVANTQGMQSFTKQQQIVPVKVQIAPLPRSKSLPTVTKSISYGATGTPRRTGKTTLQSSSSFSTPGYISKDAVALTDHYVWLSLVSIDSGNSSTAQSYPKTATTSNAKFPPPTVLAPPPFLLQDPKPTSLYPLSRQIDTVSTPAVHPSFSTPTVHPIGDPVTSNEIAPSPWYPAPELTPVTPSQLPRRTADFQKLFFPQVLDDEEDNLIANTTAAIPTKNPIELEYFDFLLNSTIEGTE